MPKKPRQAEPTSGDVGDAKPAPSAKHWRRVIDAAHNGDARLLLELLLRPYATDSKGEALPGAFYALPDDVDLRARIVWALMKGPWAKADTLDDLMMKTGWGKTKPKVSDFEIDVAAVSLALSKEHDLEAHAGALGLTVEQLRKRMQQRAKQRRKP